MQYLSLGKRKRIDEDDAGVDLGSVLARLAGGGEDPEPVGPGTTVDE